MKKKTKTLVLGASIIIAMTFAFNQSCNAADFYINKGATGSGTGANWSNAWNELNKINWSQVSPGDTIWIAGGTYTTNAMVGAGGTNNAPQYNKSGTSAKPIYLKRVLSTDSVPAAATGWSSSFDSQVVLSNAVFQWASGVDGTGSYVTIDGRTDTGSSCGIKCGGVSMDTGNTGVVLRYVDMAGPAGSAPYSFSSDDVAFYAVNYSGRGIINSPTLSYCRMHGVPNAMKISVNGILVEFSKLYDVNVLNFTVYHGNIIYTVNTTGTCIFRGNEISNWDSEGIMLKGSGQKWEIYSNLFHDPVSGNKGVGRALEAEDGQHTVYFYNNTLVNLWRGLYTVQGGTFSSSSQSRNNIFWGCATNSDNSIADADYNFTDQSSITGSHSIASGSNPFISSTNYHISSTVSAKLPNQKGTVVLTDPGYLIDFSGAIRPATAWAIGAFDPQATGSSSNPGVTLAPSNAFVSISVGQ